MQKILKIGLLALLLFMGGNRLWAQVKGESGLKWYSWNASGGFMLPLDPFTPELLPMTEHRYRFSGTPGFTFSISKPVTLQLNLGAELEDLRIDGKLAGDLLLTELYNARLRTYSFFAQFYVLPNLNLNQFVLLKAGRSGINMDKGVRDLSRTIPADLWEWVFTGGYGVTYHFDPNFSINLYGEFSPVPNRYIGELFSALSDPDKRNIPMTRIVLTVTGHTDIRVFYPFNKGRGWLNRYQPDNYLPFYRERVRKKKR